MPISSCLADPHTWTSIQVIQWLSWAISEFTLDGVQMGNFSMCGKDVMGLGKEAFLQLAPPFTGDILWEHLDILQRGQLLDFMQQ